MLPYIVPVVVGEFVVWPARSFVRSFAHSLRRNITVYCGVFLGLPLLSRSSIDKFRSMIVSVIYG